MPVHPANLVRPHGFETLEVEGELPAGLAGTLYRCGPALMDRLGSRLPHPFEADGMIIGVRLDGRGGAEGGVRVVTTAGYHEEEAAGRLLYSRGAPWLRRVVNGLRGKVKNTGNTRAWTWGERVFALMEAAPPVEIDPATLETLAERDLDGAVVRSFSAHPRRVAGQGRQVNFGQRYGKQAMLDLYSLADSGAARRLTSVAAPWPGMVHDFILTEHYAVFLHCPAELQLGRALLQLGDFSSWFRWAPERGTRILVVPLAEPESVVELEAEPFWVWHFVNGFEDRGEIVLDYCRYPNLDSLAAIASKRPVAPSMLHRARLDPKARRFTSEQRWDTLCEFPRVAPEHEGRPHTHTWMQIGREDDGRGVARVEIETGAAQRWVDDNLVASEPIPAGRAPADGSPWILTLCHDRARNTSCVAVLDGGDLEAGPVARLHFDQPLPQSFHGDWAPA